MTAAMVVIAQNTPLELAWQHTGQFWAQTGMAIVHHPVALLACAAVPAWARGYMLLHERLGRGSAALLEALVTLWRVLLFVAAVWAATTGAQWRALREQVGAVGAWQVALSELGGYLAHHVRMMLWELLFLALTLILAYLLLRLCLRGLAGRVVWLQPARHRRAAMSVARNLIFAPVLVIYLVEMARPAFR